MEIVELKPGDEARVLAASHLMDGPAGEDATRRFLAEPTHHLFIAYEDGEPAGFVSGVELTHPDKGTEMFLYELAVDERFRRRGIGRALVNRLAELSRSLGHYGMYTLTEGEDEAEEIAKATYRSGGASEDGRATVMLWDFTAG